MKLTLPARSHTALTHAVLCAEVIAHYFPKLVEIHNYSAANSVRTKVYNWQTLNRACAAFF